MKRISSDSEFERKISYSRAVVDDNYVFVSGTTGYNYEDMSISNDPAEQAEQCFKNIEKVLNQAGSSIDNIVRIRYILPNRLDFEPCWPVFQKYLAHSKPAATMFIAKLLEDSMKIEIEVTAKIT